MTMKSVLDLGLSADGHAVFLDYANTNVEYHLLETPNLLDLVREVLLTIYVVGEDQVTIERDLGRIIGTTNLIKTTDDDEIVYAKRIGRNKYSRFAKNRQPIACNSIVVVLRKGDQGYYLWTAMCGKLLPEEAYEQDSYFNNTHALAYDKGLVQIDTVTNGPRPVC